MGETWTTVDARVTKYADAANGGNSVAIQAPGNPNSGTVGGTAKRRVHCWTGEPTWRKHIDREGDKSMADEHAAKKDEVIEIADILSLVWLLNRAKSTGKPIDFLDFHTHGGSGFVALEKKLEGGMEESGLGWMNLFRLDGHEGAFNRGATIECHGCNVGEDFEGEVFLYEVCARLLPKGGIVGASTGGGFAFGDLGPLKADKGGTFHPFGDWVTWEAKPENGTANMVGKNISHYHKVNEVLTESRKKLEAVIKKRGRVAILGENATKNYPLLVAAARQRLKSDTPSETPSRIDICWGRAFTQAAEQILLQNALHVPFTVSNDTDDAGELWAQAIEENDDMAIAVAYAMDEESASDGFDAGADDGEDALADDEEPGNSEDALASADESDDSSSEGGDDGWSLSTDDIAKAIGLG